MHLDVLDLRQFYYRTRLGRIAQKAVRDQVTKHNHEWTAAGSRRTMRVFSPNDATHPGKSSEKSLQSGFSARPDNYVTTVRDPFQPACHGGGSRACIPWLPRAGTRHDFSKTALNRHG